MDEDHDDSFDADDRFAVWPENWESLGLFLACSTQWNVIAIPVGMEAGHLRYIGLRYEGCAAVMNDLKVKDRARAWGDLRLMEAEAKAVINEHINRRY